MKRLVSITIALAMILTLTACGGENGQNPGGQSPEASPQSGENPTDLSVSFQQEGDVTVITCDTPYVTEFAKEAPGTEENQFSLEFQNDGEGPATAGFQISFQYADKENPEPMATFHSFAGEENHATWDQDGSMVFTVTENTATWVCSGFVPPLDGVETVSVYAYVGGWDKHLFRETLTLADVQQSDEITVSTGVELPFDIVGEYMSWNPGEPRLSVEETPGGYVLYYGDVVSQPMQPEIERMDSGGDAMDEEVIRFHGSVAEGAPAEGENWRMTVQFSRFEDTPAPTVSVAIMDVATNDQSTALYGTLNSFHIRLGTYFEWNPETESRRDVLKVEYENRKFRFTMLDTYVTDWLEPTDTENNRYNFMEVVATDASGAKYKTNIYLDGSQQSLYSSAQIDMATADRTDRLLMSNAYSPLDEDAALTGYEGSYQSEPNANQEHSVVVEKDSLTVDERYTVGFTMEDLLMRWRPITITDTQTGETMKGNMSIYSEDGKFKLTLSDYDGKLQVVANK